MRVLAADPKWPTSLTLGTASPGGIYYVYGDALAKILTEKLGIWVNPLPTQGPVHNVKLLDSGGAQLGLTNKRVGLQGWNGTGDSTNGKSFRNMRALFPMYDTPLQAVVLQKSGITTLAQLDKKRIAVGPKAGTGGTYIPAILKLLGISAEIDNGSFRSYGHCACCRSERRSHFADRSTRASDPGCSGEEHRRVNQTLFRTN